VEADTTDPTAAQAAETGLWLNLSGGGFRAAIFHYGCVRRLHELGALQRLVGISATSGGAIVAALWGMHVHDKLEELLNTADHSALDGRDQLIGDAETGAWENFERDLISLVSRGALGPTAQLIGAFALSLCAAFASILAGVGAVTQLWTVALGLLVAAVFSEIALATTLIRDGALRQSTWITGTIPCRSPRARFLAFGRALVSPSRLRWYTMDLRLFRGFRALGSTQHAVEGVLQRRQPRGRPPGRDQSTTGKRPAPGRTRQAMEATSRRRRAADRRSDTDCARCCRKHRIPALVRSSSPDDAREERPARHAAFRGRRGHRQRWLQARS
jgi:hypothetical protein